MKLTDPQRRVIRQLRAEADAQGEWVDLSTLGISRATVRALMELGALEAKESDGFPGQLNGQKYRLTHRAWAEIEPRSACAE